MTKQTRNPNLIETSNYSINTRETISILKWIDSGSFDKLVKSFWSEKEENKIILSWFLNSTNVKLSQLWNIKIDINNIKNYIRNKPDISKDLEKKIAKLFLEKLYETWSTNIPFMSEIKDAFDIKSKADIENKNIDFKTIQVNINKLSDNWNENIDSVAISNDEIFDLMGNDINKIADFQSQNVSSQQEILDLLNFEVKWVINYVKSRWEDVEYDMNSTMKPNLNISRMFEDINDTDIANLLAKKWKMEDLQELALSRDIFKDKVSLKKYIERCKKIWMDDDSISKLKKLLLGKVDEEQIKRFYKNEFEKLNKQIWKKYLENFENKWASLKFVSIMKKLIQNNFDFSKLENKEQSILWQTLVVNEKSNTFEMYTWLDQDEYKKFLKDLYDFEKQDISMDVDWVWSINLHIKKNVKKWENKVFLDVENFKTMDSIQPFEFTVNIDDNTPEFIQDLEDEDTPLRSNWIMETHITKWWKLNIWNGYTLEICGKQITKSQIDELLDCDSDKDALYEKLKNFWLYDDLKDQVDSVYKNMYNPQNVCYDYDEDWFAQNNDQWYWPYGYRYCIFEEMLKNLDVKILERNLIFEWNNVDKLSQIYIMSKFGWFKGKDKQDQQVKKIFDADRDLDEELGDAESWEAKAQELWNDIKLDYDWWSPDDEDDNWVYEFDWKIEEDAERFRNQLDDEWKKAFKDRLYSLCDSDTDIEDSDRIRDELDNLFYNLENPTNSVQWDDNDTDEPIPEKEKTPEEQFQESWEGLSGDKECKCEVWTRLYFDLWESQLEPKDISDATKSFYCFEIVNVWEDKFSLKAIWWDLKSSLAGNVYELPKTKEQLDFMKKWWSIYKVRKNTSRDRNSCIESINKAEFFKKFTTFGNIDWQVHLDGNKFVNDKWEEIKYFDRIEWVFDSSKKEVKDRWQWNKLYKYEIKKVNTSKWTVTLESTFDGYDENENYKEVKYKYENEIPFEQFILLMEWKRLKWYTEAEQKEMETKYEINDPKRLATKWMRKWISIWSIINVFKNTTKSIKAKLDENKKEQDEFLENYLFSQEWLDLYGKLWWLFGNSSIWDAIKKSQYEFYTNRENRTRKKIEEWYKIFESDPNYSEYFAEHLQHILNREWYVWNDKDRYKFAAAFLIMVKKEWPYPRVFANQKDKWKRVENILWPEHKTRFLNFYEKKKHEIEQAKDMWYPSWDRLEKQEELNKMEIQYIVSTIDGRAPYGPASNEFMLKSVWWLKFMSTLEENAKWYYNKHEEEKNSLETFYAAEESYLRNLWSWKFQKALPALERMCETAKTKWEAFRVKWYLLGAMLMWIIKNNSSAKTIKSFWWTCRAMWFTPGYRMRDIEHQDKIQVLLDWITDGEFSKELKYNISDFEPWNIKDLKYSFGKQFQWYWNVHGENILKKIEDPTNKLWGKSIIDLANEKDNPNNHIFKDIIKNSTTNEIDKKWDVSTIFAQESPLSATSDMIKEYIPQWGRYKPSDPEKLSDCEDFWKFVRERIPSWDAGKEKTWLLFKKYFNWFNSELDSNDKQMIVKSLPLIQEEKSLWHKKEAEFMLWYMIKWILHENTRWSFPEDFEVVANKFVDFFYSNIWYIDKDLIKETFSDREICSSFDEPYHMLNWWEYLKYNMSDTKWLYNSKRNDYNNSMNYYLNSHNINEDDVINKKIENIWRSIHNKCTVPDKLIWSTAWENFQIMTRQEINNQTLLRA